MSTNNLCFEKKYEKYQIFFGLIFFFFFFLGGGGGGGYKISNIFE